MFLDDVEGLGVWPIGRGLIAVMGFIAMWWIRF